MAETRLDTAADMDKTPATGDGPAEEHVDTKASDVPAASTSAAEGKKPVEEYPDPDEDDLDDLDDMLDDFSAAKQNSTKSAAPTLSKPAPTTQPAEAAPAQEETDPEPKLSEEEVSRQLQAGVAGMIAHLEQDPDMRQKFDDMMEDVFNNGGVTRMEELMRAEGIPTERSSSSRPPGGNAPNAAAPKTSSAPPVPSVPASTPDPPPVAPRAPDTSTADAAAEASFQETIRRTMERMQTSGDQATAAASSGSGENDFMADLMRQMSSGELPGGGGEGSEEDFSKILMGMMEQLTNKEILYEPMKELHDKYPGWFAKNRATTGAEDLKRYDEQRELVKEIVEKFEESTYTDSDPADRQFIVDRMQKMQAAGSPPEDLVGDLESAQEAFAATEDQCNPQ